LPGQKSSKASSNYKRQLSFYHIALRIGSCRAPTVREGDKNFKFAFLILPKIDYLILPLLFYIFRLAEIKGNLQKTDYYGKGKFEKGGVVG
jgi:hypothetical protein